MLTTTALKIIYNKIDTHEKNNFKSGFSNHNFLSNN